MTRELDELQNLVKVIKTGNEFYEHVIEDTDDAELRAVCAANLADRRRLLKALARTGKEEQLEPDLEVRLEQERADLLAAVEPNYLKVYMDHLEDLEDKTQQAYRKALAAVVSSDIRTLLQGQEPEWQVVHDRMRVARQTSTNRETPKTIPTRLMR